MLIVTHI